MTLNIPDGPEAAFINQAYLYQTDVLALGAGLSGDGVLSGGGLTQQVTPDLTMSLAALVARIGDTIATRATANVTFASAHATLPRWDLVVINNAGAASVVAGTASATFPTIPDVPANSIALWAVWRPAADDTLTDDLLVDKRVNVQAESKPVARNAGAITIVNSAAETDVFNETIRAGLMGINRMLRLTLFGDMLNNTGANQTATIRVYFGGTTVYADASGNIATSTTRRPVMLGLMLANLGANNSQFMSALLTVGTAGSATTGIGDFAAAGFREAQIASNGLLAINTGNDAILRVSIQLGAANAALDFRKFYAACELV